MADSTTPRVFFTRSYTYRKPNALIMALAVMSFSGFFLVKVALSIPGTEWSWGVIPVALFVIGIPGMLFFAGAWILRAWIKHTTLMLEITDHGIRYGGKWNHSWDEIRWISGHTEREGIQLFYQKRGRFLARFDRPIHVQPALTLEEYQELMVDLETALSDRYPEVSFG